jgi:hypothetical protein
MGATDARSGKPKVRGEYHVDVERTACLVVVKPDRVNRFGLHRSRGRLTSHAPSDAKTQFTRRLRMPTLTGDKKRAAIPKRRQKHHSYNENVDESANLIADEPVEIEEERPAEENESLQRAEDDTKPETPTFEE